MVAATPTRAPAPARPRATVDWRLRLAFLSLVRGFSVLLIKTRLRGRPHDRPVVTYFTR